MTDIIMRTLSAGDLTLEPQVSAHADAMFVVLSDPAIYEFENAPPASLDGLRERFRKLESRLSADGSELWLNWVVRLPTQALAGYVQATVGSQGRAAIAYELASAHWGQGIARRAVLAMIDELVAQYGVASLYAVLKCRNHRSQRLLQRLGFEPMVREPHILLEIDANEMLMRRPAVMA